MTGLAAAFGQQLGASRADRQRLSFAGMLHDIGKARIPLAILEKPGPLDHCFLLPPNLAPRRDHVVAARAQQVRDQLAVDLLVLRDEDRDRADRLVRRGRLRRLDGPLQAEVLAGRVNIRYIPKR